jgi:hypothetical protein
MLKTVEGVFKNGKVQLNELPPDVQEARVLVTFLPARGERDLEAAGLTEAEAADLRFRFEAFAEDWDRPDMDVYNDM